MTQPSLALGISAAGKEQVAELAAAVASLKNNLKDLAQTAGGSSLQNLDGLTKEFRDMRVELVQAVQGMRTDLAAGMKQAFSGAARAAKEGGEEVEGEVKKAAAKVRIAAKGIDLGGGLSASVSGAGLASKEAVAKMVDQVKQDSSAIASAAEGQAKALFGWKLKIMAGSAQIAEALEQAATKEEQAKLAYRARLMIGSAKIVEDAEKAAAAEETAKLNYRIKMMTGSAKIAEQSEKAAEKEDAARLNYRVRMMVGSAKIAEDADKAAAKEDAARLGYRVKMMTGSAKIAEDAAAAAAREEAAKLAWTAKMMVGAAKIEEARIAAADKELRAAQEEAAKIDLASRTVEAAYAAMSQRAQLRTQVRARAQLDQGIAPSAVAGRFGTTATIAAGNASGLDALKEQLAAVPGRASPASASLNKLTVDLDAAHSAARGLASGFGAMWLTWGQIAPLLAGAALSHAFVETVKMGAEVEQQLATIRVLSEESTLSVSNLNNQLLTMARTGPFGPREIATAMKTLSLAGLDAAAVATSINDVLHFAVAGDTTIQKSSELMTTIGTAFKLAATDYNYIGDVVAKTAAVSKASVETISDSFKSASVINSQYGVSLKDMGLGIAILNNVGVAGSNAGTALRNFYVDILGRTPKVQKALVAIGLDANFAFDKATGKARDFVSIITELNAAVSKKDAIGQTKALQDIFSERGGKGALEAIALIRAKMKDTRGEFANDLLYMQHQIEDSAGFMSVSFAEMSLTTSNQVKSTVSALQASLVQAFDSVQPYVVETAQSLKNAFNSQEFQTTIGDLVRVMGALTVGLVENIGTVIKLGEAWLAFKVLGTVAGLIQLTTDKLLLGTAALTGNAFAAEAAAAANSGLAVSFQKRAAAEQAASVAAGATAAASTSVASAFGSVLLWGTRLLGWLGLAIGAWQLYSMWTDKSDISSKAKADHSGALLTALKAEADRLHDVNQARILNISLEELALRKRVEAARLEGAGKGVSDSTAAEAARMESLANSGPEVLRDRRLKSAAALRERAAAEASAEASDARFSAKAIEKEQTRIRDEAQQQAKATEAAIRARSLIPAGGDPYALPGRAGRARGASTGQSDNTMSTLNSELQMRESALKTAYDKEMQLLDQKHRGELVSEGTYQSEVLNLTQQFEQEQRALVANELAAQSTAMEEKRAKITANMKGDARKQALDNLQNDYDKFVASANSTLSKLNSDAFERQQRSVISLEAETKKITKTNDEYWIKAEAGAKKETDLAAARAATAGMTDEAKAALEASIKVEDQHSAHMELLKRDYLLAAQALEDFTTAQADNDSTTAESITRYQSLVKQVVTFAQALELSQEKIDALKASAAEGAVKEVQTKRANDLYKNLSNTIADSILNGGQKGFKSLRDWAKDYFIKQPLQIAIQAGLQSLFGSSGGALGGGGTGLIEGLTSAFSKAIRGYSNTPANTGFSDFGSNLSFGTASAGSLGLQGFGSFGGFGGTALAGGFNAFGSDGATASAAGSPSILGSVLSNVGSSGLMGLAGGTSHLIGLGSSVLGGGMSLGNAGATLFANATTTGAGALDGLMTATGAFGTAGAAAAEGAGLAGGAAAAGEGLMGTISGGLAAIGPVGWVALAAIAAYAIFGGSGGGPKVESGFGGGVSQRGDPATAKAAVQSIQDLYKEVGGKGNLDVGLFSATDPEGDAKTQLEVNASLDGRQFYNRGARLGGIENVGRDEKDLQKAIAEETERVVLGALKESHLAGSVGEYLDQLGDLGNLSVDALAKAVERASRIGKEKATLDERMFQLEHTESEILLHNRQVEVDALDELNKAQMIRIHALEDEKTAATKLETAIDAAKAQTTEYLNFLISNGVSIKQYIDKLNATPAGVLPADQQLSNAHQQFDRQYALAKAGDRTALGSITGYADQLISAKQGYEGNTESTVKVIADIKAMLAGLPGVESDAQMMARATKEAGDTVAATVVDAKNSIWAGLWGSAGMLSTKFDVLDTQVDGLLDFNELKAAIGSLADDNTILALIAQADTNSDGQVSKLEAIRASIVETTAMQTAILAPKAEIPPQGLGGPGPAPEAVNKAVYDLMVTETPGNPNNPGYYADGGAFSNSIVTSPTAFMSANGPSVMGEAGPEAVMPLANVGGTLGVRVAGGGNSREVVAELRSMNDKLTQRLDGLTRVVAAYARDDLAHGAVTADATSATAQAARREELKPVRS